MSRKLKIFSAVLFMVLMLNVSMSVMAAEDIKGSAAAAIDKSYTIEEMLTYAIQDEYIAQAEYDAIMDKFGVQQPFSNIIRSEATHIQLLTPLFKTYGFKLPINDASKYTVVPTTISESYTVGVTAEIKNIAMYESFLKEKLPADIKSVFETLKAASEKHLAAFERSVSKASNSRNRRFRN